MNTINTVNREFTQHLPNFTNSTDSPSSANFINSPSSTNSHNSQNSMTLSRRIKHIFEQNEIDDLEKFMNKRECLNNCNFYMIYLFYLVQSAGILVTTIATGYNAQIYIWLGVGLNIFASLIHVYEQTNNNISSKLLKDIQLIKNNNYTDEGALIDLDDDKGKKDPVTFI
jgi:hypothetical protein